MITPDRIRTVLADLEEAMTDQRVDPGYALEMARELLADLLWDAASMPTGPDLPTDGQEAAQ